MESTGLEAVVVVLMEVVVSLLVEDEVIFERDRFMPDMYRLHFYEYSNRLLSMRK
jgi:hypothetical protein